MAEEEDPSRADKRADDAWGEVFDDSPAANGGPTLLTGAKAGGDGRSNRLNQLQNFNEMLQKERGDKGVEGEGGGETTAAPPEMGGGIRISNAQGEQEGNQMQQIPDQNAIIAELQTVRERIISTKSTGADLSVAEETFKQAQPAFQSGDMAAVWSIITQVKVILDGGAAGAPAPPAAPTKEEAIGELTRARQELVALKELGYDTTRGEDMFQTAQPLLRDEAFADAMEVAQGILGFIKVTKAGGPPEPAAPAGGDPKAEAMAELAKVKAELVEAKEGGIAIGTAEETFKEALGPLGAGDFAAVGDVIARVRQQLQAPAPGPPGAGAPSAGEPPAAEGPAGGDKPTAGGNLKEMALGRLADVRNRIIKLKESGWDVAPLEELFGSAEPVLREGNFVKVMELVHKINVSADEAEASAAAPAPAPPTPPPVLSPEDHALLHPPEPEAPAQEPPAPPEPAAPEPEAPAEEPPAPPEPAAPEPEAPAEEPPAPPEPEVPEPEAPAEEPPAHSEPAAPEPEAPAEEPPAPPEPEAPEPEAPGGEEMSPEELQTNATALFMEAQKRMVALKGEGGDTSAIQGWLKKAGGAFAQKDFGAILAMKGELPE